MHSFYQRCIAIDISSDCAAYSVYITNYSLLLDDFLLMFNSNCNSILHTFRYTAVYWSKMANLSYPAPLFERDYIHSYIYIFRV